MGSAESTAKQIAYSTSGSEKNLLKALHEAGAVVLRAYPAPNYSRASDSRRDLLQVHVRFPDGTMGYFSPGGPPRVWNYVFTAGHQPGVDENLPGVDPHKISQVTVSNYSERPALKANPMQWTRFSNPGAYRAHRAPPTSVDWGSPYGSSPYVTPDGQRVWMFRKGQRVRFFDAQGSQVGPEQANVAPAAAFAYAMGWENEEMLRRGIRPHPDDPTFKDFGKLAKNPTGSTSYVVISEVGGEYREWSGSARILHAKEAVARVVVKNFGITARLEIEAEHLHPTSFEGRIFDRKRDGSKRYLTDKVIATVL